MGGVGKGGKGSSDVNMMLICQVHIYIKEKSPSLPEFGKSLRAEE